MMNLKVFQWDKKKQTYTEPIALGECNSLTLQSGTLLLYVDSLVLGPAPASEEETNINE